MKFVLNGHFVILFGQKVHICLFDLIFLGQKWQFALVYYTAGQKAYGLVCGHFIVVIECLTGGSIHSSCKVQDLLLEKKKKLF